MREPYTQLYVHVVWSTWDRVPLLTPGLARAVYACIRAECHQLKVDVVAIGGMADHIHLLVRIPTTVSVANLVKQVKGVSSHLVTHQLDRQDGFKWQGAYGAFTVSKSNVPQVRSYILNQEEHHRAQSLDHDLEPPIWSPQPKS
jgi:putative transposase